jgi:transposase
LVQKRRAREAAGVKRDPHDGHLFVFRGRRGGLIKVLWHDGQGMCLYAKRLERGRFIWPSSADGMVTISSAQLGYLLEGIDWRMPQQTGARRPLTDCGIVNHDAIGDSQPHRLVIPSLMMALDDSLPTDLASAHALIIAQRQALAAAENETWHFTIVALLGVTLGSCASQRVWRSAAHSNQAEELYRIADFIERDDAQCQASGLAPGSRPYRECRTRLANARDGKP